MTDLTRDDFVLTDAGQPQRVDLFSVESNVAMQASAEPLPPNTYSNRYERRGDIPTSVTVILLDALNTRFEDQSYSRDQLIRFLEQLQPHDRVAIYTLGTRLRVLHDFTSDAAPLLRALQRYHGRPAGEVDASEPDPPNTGSEELDAWLAERQQQMANFYVAQRALRTLSALEAIANHLAQLPGRKNLVWVSSSFPFSYGYETERLQTSLSVDRRTFSPEIERTTRALNNANLAIYPVDAKGLMGPFQVGLQGRLRMTTLGSTYGGLATMQTLADRTGGRAFYNTNDIQGSIRRAIEDSRVTYVLGYYPTHGQWNGKFREIKVQVNRRGARVRHRRGYYAFADRPLESDLVSKVLVEASASPLDATAVGLTVRAQKVEIPGARRLKVDAEIDARSLSLALTPDAAGTGEPRWVGAIDILLVQTANDGRRLDSTDERVQMRLTRESYQDIQQNGLRFSKHLPLDAAASQVRIVVRDATSGAVGSLRIPL